MTVIDFIDLAKNMVVVYFNKNVGYWEGSVPRKDREINRYDVVLTAFRQDKDDSMSVELMVIDDYETTYCVEYDPNRKEHIQSRIIRMEKDYECDIRPIFR